MFAFSSLLLVRPALAECPLPSEAYVRQITAAMEAADTSQEPLPVGSLPDGLLQSDVALERSPDNPTDLGPALQKLAVDVTGGTRKPPGFGDVNYAAGVWTFYVQPDLVFVANDGDLRGHFVHNSDLSATYYRICPGLAEAYDQTAASGTLDETLASKTEPEQRDDRKVDEGNKDVARPTVAWGLGVAFDGAFGDAAGSLFSSAMGGNLWVATRLKGSPFEGRITLRGARATGAPYTWGGVEGTLDSGSVRLTPDGCLRIPIEPLSASVSVGLGPALALFTEDLHVGDYAYSADELVVGGHVGGNIIWFPKHGPGVTFGVGGEAYLHRSNWEQPLLLGSVTVGLALGGREQENKP